MNEIGLLSRPHKAPSYEIRFIGARSFDADSGAEILLDVLRNHDHRADEYREKAKAFLATVGVDYPENIRLYENALLHLFVNDEC